MSQPEGNLHHIVWGGWSQPLNPHGRREKPSFKKKRPSAMFKDRKEGGSAIGVGEVTPYGQEEEEF